MKDPQNEKVSPHSGCSEEEQQMLRIASDEEAEGRPGCSTVRAVLTDHQTYLAISSGLNVRS